MDIYAQQDKGFILPDEDQEANDHLSSLRYAGIIQHALMPNPEILKGHIRDYFILFLPRDIVSGDFYYVFSNRSETARVMEFPVHL